MSNTGDPVWYNIDAAQFHLKLISLIINVRGTIKVAAGRLPGHGTRVLFNRGEAGRESFKVATALLQRSCACLFYSLSFMG